MANEQLSQKSLDTSRLTGLYRKQANELSELYTNFVTENPGVSARINDDLDLTTEQITAWEVYSANLLAFHEAERP
ncbi:MAG: hypothetical protein JWO07_5 [Candidatus Saccharibacteria bacterium]|nr:hypothetical protein [Candidatus Saccharibacteria bacterium]